MFTYWRFWRRRMAVCSLVKLIAFASEIWIPTDARAVILTRTFIINNDHRGAAEPIPNIGTAGFRSDAIFRVPFARFRGRDCVSAVYPAYSTPGETFDRITLARGN
ncbi:Protein of unknown function [Pyronema omphalodes CBS 100304]|uniref:Uncharacterized protein n=1 Tax=Pyronema omphalodes (strain CBS 100304) TaxID=1076935 RepID=U4LA31_PYROM|nr:Protein of unknown function [Pyronema omphalodes CBS 100304]